MQNRYVGDVGDFGKYGLLKSLCLSNKTDNGLTLSLGVVWYLTLDEAHNADGKHTEYLKLTSPKRECYRECDPELYDSLKEIVDQKSRDVKYIRKKGILPATTVFYERCLDYNKASVVEQTLRETPLDHRERWMEGALDATANCNIVFVDPDNGLETSSTARHQLKGVKYAFFDELSPFLHRGQSLVVYQHINHTEKAEKQIQRRLQEIKERLNPRADPFALHFRRVSARAFFIIPSERHQTLLRERAKHFSNGLWSRHFDLVDPIAPTA